MTNLFEKRIRTGKVFLLGDVHIGHVQADKKGFERAVKEISNSAGGDDAVIFMGDLLDAVQPTDRRFDARAFETLDEAKTYLDSVIDPLTDIDVLMLEGNHEYVVGRSGNNPVLFFLARRPKWKYGSYGSIVDLGRLWGYVNHGHGGGRYHGAKVNNIEREAGQFEGADFFFMGHVHWLFVNRYTKIGYNRRRKSLTHNRMHIGYTGSFLRTYTLDAEVSTYGERAVYSDVERGYLSMRIEDNTIVGVDVHGLP